MRAHMWALAGKEVKYSLLNHAYILFKPKQNKLLIHAYSKSSASAILSWEYFLVPLIALILNSTLCIRVRNKCLML